MCAVEERPTNDRGKEGAQEFTTGKGAIWKTCHECTASHGKEDGVGRKILLQGSAFLYSDPQQRSRVTGQRKLIQTYPNTRPYHFSFITLQHLSIKTESAESVLAPPLHPLIQFWFYGCTTTPTRFNFAPNSYR